MFRANEATKQSMLIPNVVSSVALALGGELHMNTFKQTEGFITVYLDRARNLEPLSKHALVWKKEAPSPSVEFAFDVLFHPPMMLAECRLVLFHLSRHRINILLASAA